MNDGVISECVEELRERANPTPAVTAARRSIRQLRATELNEVHAVVNSAAFYTRGYRSATDWLIVTTNEGVGKCKLTLRLADRIQNMPLVKETFATGDLAESALHLLVEAWDPTIASEFSRDEHLLVRWGLTLAAKDLKLILNTWRMNIDPNRESTTAQERFDQRALHLSEIMDGVGVLNGVLDPEGLSLVREAIRALSMPAKGESRTIAQRRADALVEMARSALGSLEPIPGKKRRKPKVIATIAYDDLVAGTNGGVVDTDLDTIVVPADTIRRMACDCNVHRYISNPLGTVTDYGRSQRVVTDTLFDTLLIRDHGCRWPGCSIPAGSCDAHHATHWLNNGETKPDNLVLLCWFHHHLLHEQHWSIEPLGGGHFNLNSPHGDAQILRPPMVGIALPTEPPKQPPLPS